MRRIAAAVALATALAGEPAAATLRAFRIDGFAWRIRGDPALFPLPFAGTGGEQLTLEFHVDDAIADGNPGNPDTGVYRLEYLAVSSEAGSATFVDEPSGDGSIVIQATQVGAQSWTVSGCRAGCDGGDYDEAFLRVLFTDHPIASDALTIPMTLNPETATLEYGLFSSDDIAERETLLEGIPFFVNEVPEPAGALSLAAGALVLATASRARDARRASGSEAPAAR